MNKVPYWKHGYGKLICSKCGYVIDERDDMRRYLYYRQKRDVCPECKADMREPYKRCYWKEHYPDKFNPCGDLIHINDADYCYRRTKERMDELKSWGCYYKCECMHAPESENEQLTLY